MSALSCVCVCTVLCKHEIREGEKKDRNEEKNNVFSLSLSLC